MRITQIAVAPSIKAAHRALLAGVAAAALVTALLTVGFATPAHACTCAQMDLSSLAKQGDAVFVGTPVAVETDNGQKVYEVRVSDVYSGSPGPTTTVRSAASGASCGIKLDLEQQYMFVGDQNRVHGDVSTTICSGTRPISDEAIAAVEKSLGPATPFRGNSGGESGNGSGNSDGQPENTTDGQTDDGGDADSDQAPASDGSDDANASDGGSGAGQSVASVVILALLAVAVGGSFLLPRLRRKNRTR